MSTEVVLDGVFMPIVVSIFEGCWPMREAPMLIFTNTNSNHSI